MIAFHERDERTGGKARAALHESGLYHGFRVMIEQTGNALNLSASPPRKPAPENTPATTHPGGAPPIFAFPPAANENPDPANDAARLAAEALAREKARAERQARRQRERRRWLRLLLFVLVVLTSLRLFAAQVVQLLPGMAHLYKAAGVAVQAPGFAVQDLRMRWVPGADGNLELAIGGHLVNKTRRTLPMPNIALALLDDMGREIYQWRIPQGAASALPAGKRARFHTRIADVPPAAISLRLRILPRPEATH